MRGCVSVDVSGRAGGVSNRTGAVGSECLRFESAPVSAPPAGDARLGDSELGPGDRGERGRGQRRLGDAGGTLGDGTGLAYQTLRRAGTGLPVALTEGRASW